MNSEKFKIAKNAFVLQIFFAFGFDGTNPWGKRAHIGLHNSSRHGIPPHCERLAYRSFGMSSDNLKLHFCKISAILWWLRWALSCHHVSEVTLLRMRRHFARDVILALLALNVGSW